MSFFDLKIKSKFLLSAIVNLSLLIITIVVSNVVLQQIYTSFSGITERSLPQFQLLLEMNVKAANIDTLALALLTAENSHTKEDNLIGLTKKKLAEEVNRFQLLKQQYMKTQKTNASKIFNSEKIKAIENDIINDTDKVVQLKVQSGSITPILVNQYKTLDDNIAKLQSAILITRQNYLNELHSQYLIIQKEYKQSFRISISIGIILIALNLLIAMILSTHIIEPIEKLSKLSKYIAKQGIPDELPPIGQPNDEIGLLSENIHEMIVAIQKQDEKLIDQATHDALTHLPNRALLMDRLSLMIATAHRKNTEFSLIFLDLDKFKQINDTYGHNAGDFVLRSAATIFLNAVRQTDTVARIGGDEFIILLTDTSDFAQIEKIGKIIAEKIKVPMEHEGTQYRVSVSMGVAVYPNDGNDIKTLLHHADIALYKSKKSGKGKVVFYHPKWGN